MDPNHTIQVLAPSNEEDHEWFRNLWIAEWGSELMVARGETYTLQDVEALIAWADGVRVGAASYQVREHDGELTSINATACRYTYSAGFYPDSPE